VVTTNLGGFVTNAAVATDVTGIVRSEAAADGLLSLRLIPLASGINLNFGSREQSDPLLRPKLLVSTNPPPLVIQAQPALDHLTLSWPAGYAACRLQMQTNGLGQGLGNNWIDAGVVTNPLVLPIGPQNGSTFYRLQPF
jgi:hypothetical protein